jgi:hypothetical protein
MWLRQLLAQQLEWFTYISAYHCYAGTVLGTTMSQLSFSSGFLMVCFVMLHPEAGPPFSLRLNRKLVQPRLCLTNYFSILKKPYNFDDYTSCNSTTYVFILIFVQ